MEKSIKHNVFTGHQQTKGPYLTNKRKKLIEKYNSGLTDDRESQKVEELIKLFEMSKQSKSIDQQFQDVTRCQSRGVLDFPASGMSYYNAIKILLIGSSGSGKSTNVLNLLLESPNSYEAIHLICPESSYNNETYTTLRYYCGRAGIKFYWSDSDSDVPLEFGNADDKDSKGSSKFLHDNKLPMFVIFDDCYKGNKSSWLTNLMSECFIKLRHRMINTIICQQSPNYIQSSVVLNWSHLFVSGNFLSREGIWDRLKIPTPENIAEMYQHYNNCQDKRHQFYYIKMDDCYLKPYTPYKFQSQKQIVTKFKYKLPKGLSDVEKIDMNKAREKQEDQADEESVILDPQIYDSKEDISKVYKDGLSQQKKNIQQLARFQKNNQQQEGKRKYIIRNGYKFLFNAFLFTNKL